MGIFGSCIIATVIIFGSFVSFSDAELTQQGLRAYYSFEFADIYQDSNLDDKLSNKASSGTIYDGTINGDIVTATGKFNEAFDFDANDDVLIIPNEVIPDNSDYSISLWINPSDVSSNQGFFNTFDGSVTEKKDVQLRVTSSGVVLGFKRTDSTSPDADYVVSSSPLVTGNWYHVVFVYDNSVGISGDNYLNGALSLYVDGALVDDSVTDTNYGGSTNNPPAQIGATDLGWMPYHGKIDDVSVWNKKLSASDVDFLYNSGTGRSVSSLSDDDVTLLLRPESDPEEEIPLTESTSGGTRLFTGEKSLPEGSSEIVLQIASGGTINERKFSANVVNSNIKVSDMPQTWSIDTISGFSNEEHKIVILDQDANNNPLEINLTLTLQGISSTGVLAPIKPDCLADDDGDFVCDEWEILGQGLEINDLDGVNLAEPYTYDCGEGALGISCNSYEPTNPDVFVEVDWMPGFRPADEAIQHVIQKFADRGINLHVQLDEEVTEHEFLDIPGIAPDGTFSPDGFAEIKEQFFGNSTDRIRANTDPNYLLAKKQVFHYALFIDKQKDNPSSSGAAELPGNDMVISLGSFVLSDGTIPLEEQKGAFMHELGHNLGLYHGGDPPLDYNNDGNINEVDFEADNCKPNYRSVMNYAFQFPYYVTGFDIDFSDKQFDNLDESALVESEGVGPYSGLETVYGLRPDFDPPDHSTIETGIGINWDHDSSGTISSTPLTQSININNLGIAGCSDNTISTLKGHDDFAPDQLHFDLLSSPNVFGFGASSWSNSLFNEYSIETKRDVFVSHVDTLKEELANIPSEDFETPTSNSTLNTILDEIEDLVWENQFISGKDKITAFHIEVDSHLMGNSRDKVSQKTNKIQEAFDKSVQGPKCPPGQILQNDQCVDVGQGNGVDVVHEDTDNDGIFDRRDKCPEEPETVNGFKDNDGCPDVKEDDSGILVLTGLAGAGAGAGATYTITRLRKQQTVAS